jgi:hypothetical protein
LVQIERRQAAQGWKSWWRRLPPLKRPSRDDLVAEFLQSDEGRILLSFLGGVAALMRQLTLPDPFEGYDGRHPQAVRPSSRERLLERAAAGLEVPTRFQVLGVRAYAMWKLTGLPKCQDGFMPEDVTFISSTQAAAINSMSPAEVRDVVERLDSARQSGSRYKSILHDLNRVGAEARDRWPRIERRMPGPSLGLWQTDDDENLSEKPNSESDHTLSQSETIAISELVSVTRR